MLVGWLVLEAELVAGAGLGLTCLGFTRGARRP